MMQPTRLGPYEIGKPIGKGGMGSVYEAVDAGTGMRVAVKALSPHLAMAEGFRERFEAEIESLKTLRHNGIVRLYGYGEQDGILFYSMELVDGVSLEDELSAGRRFQWREVANIAIQLCLALKHAHDHGIVHRDIKPANILLAGDERVKLADFGIARLFGTSQLTAAGGVLGTADYMSPEQADGSPITARCDQYSLGGVMYALLTGRPPFRAKHLPEMLQLQRFAKPEPIRRFAPETPEQLEKVVLQLLAKDPADRFPNTMVLARHLQAMTRALSQPAAEPVPADEAAVEEPLPFAETQVDMSAPPPDASAGKRNPSAPTIPPEEAVTVSAEQAAKGPARDVKLSLSPPSVAPRSDVSSDRPSGTTRFTSIEEEQARQQKLHERSWLSTLPQLLGLAAALAMLAAIAFYLSRPLTADDLYDRIVSRTATDDPDSLRDVEREIHQFLERFPNDSRVGELQLYSQELELDRLERSLQAQARRDGLLDADLLPIESLYLRADVVAETDPEQAAAMLQSLVDLYGTETPEPAEAGDPDARLDDEAARRKACLNLARRQLARVQDDLARQATQQLASLRERLAAADQIAADQPELAAAMYRAIVSLYAGHDWAAPIVAEARARLLSAEETETGGE